MITFWMAAFIIALGAGWSSRMDGGGPPITPNWFERHLALWPILMFGSIWGLPGLLIAELGLAGRATGHGQWFIRRMVKAISPEFFDFLLIPFFGRDPRTHKDFEHLRGDNWAKADEFDRMKIEKMMIQYGMKRLYWRCAAGMTLTGLLTTLPLALLLLWVSAPLAAILALIAGAQKGVTYVVCYEIERRGYLVNAPMYLSTDTEMAEFFNAFNMTIILALAFVVLR